jgi:hypothetical protein
VNRKSSADGENSAIDPEKTLAAIKSVSALAILRKPEPVKVEWNCYRPPSRKTGLLSEFSETIGVLARAPPVQFWFPFGLLAGALCWPFGLRNPRALVVITFLVTIPPAVLFLQFGLAGFGVFILVLTLFYITTGFIGFCLGWVPGLLIGYVFFSIIRRRPKGG